MELKGSRTEANLNAAFAGESMARNKYTFFASQAKKEGYEQLSAIFLETADNEKAHAKIWYKQFAGIGDAAQNLKTAADGEHYEWTIMYKELAEQAKAEGFNEIAALFELVVNIEKTHDERYTKLLENFSEGKVFLKDGTVIWKCRECGHIHVGKSAPEICPVCKHPKAFFEIKAENY